MFTYINSLCNESSSRLLEYPNVVGYGNGFKVISNIETTIPTLKIFVTKKIPSQHLPENVLVPKLYRGIITDVIETGEFRTSSLTEKIRPMLLGYSIGVLDLDDSGSTAGCLVYNEDNTRYILGSNHALAQNDPKNLKKAVIQPDKFYMDGRLNKVAFISKYIPVTFKTESSTAYNVVDCAIARLISNDISSARIMYAGVPKGVEYYPKVHQNVKKIGAQSGLTTGVITSTDSVIDVNFSKSRTEKVATFKNQILTTSMSFDGDSGSVLLDEKNKVVGLLVGSSKTTSVYNPIQDVLGMLSVDLLTPEDIEFIGSRENSIK